MTLVTPEIQPQPPTPDEAAAAAGEGVELPHVPAPDDLNGVALPGGPTLERLWQLSNYDPFFYRNLVAAAGYIRAAWFASEPPIQIRPWIPPRPVPAYIGLGSSVGLFEGVSAPDFTPSTPGAGT